MADPTPSQTMEYNRPRKDDHRDWEQLPTSVPALGSIDTSNETLDESIALNPADIEAVPSLLQHIADIRADGAYNTPQERQCLMKKARELWQALETPRETMVRQNWSEVSFEYCKF